jgi:hypothetical protein
MVETVKKNFFNETNQTMHEPLGHVVFFCDAAGVALVKELHHNDDDADASTAMPVLQLSVELQ